ncbi:MAG TPA: cytochrome c [Thermoanaerobaculia bacterium]|nr:cytochrome c [Thermoanaerobaculia bacterium]
MKFLGGALAGLLAVAAGGAIFLATGSFNVSASAPAGKLEESLARFTLNRSVARRAPQASKPLVSSPERRRAGLAHYRENCVGCHGAPGVDAAEYGQGLNPPAPDLTLPRVQARSDGQLYWIVSNGVRMTGMPAFSPTHRDEELWTIVAFLRHLPELTPEEEKALKAATDEAAHHDEGSGK